MPDLQNLLDQIDRLDQQATKGPWESMGHSVESRTTFDDVVSTEVDCGTYCMGGTGEGVQDVNDAEFIALARTALPQLAEAVYQVLSLLDAEENRPSRITAIDGWQHPARVPTSEVRRAITDALGDDV